MSRSCDATPPHADSPPPATRPGPLITTANLFTEDFFQELILEPIFHHSLVLPYLHRINTRATFVNVPRVHGGNVGFVAEGAEIPDAGLGADYYRVEPKKLATREQLSNESRNDTNALAMLGDALARALAARADASFFAAQEPTDPVGLDGVLGIPEVDTAPDSGIDAYADAIGVLEGAGSVATVIFMHPATWT